jgi:hypothetical protein
MADVTFPPTTATASHTPDIATLTVVGVQSNCPTLVRCLFFKRDVCVRARSDSRKSHTAAVLLALKPSWRQLFGFDAHTAAVVGFGFEPACVRPNTSRHACDPIPAGMCATQYQPALSVTVTRTVNNTIPNSNSNPLLINTTCDMYQPQ